jgi:hypothetical protein
MKRRRRRSSAQIVAARTLTDIKQRKLAFLREVSSILSDALGFTVKVTLSKPDRMAGLSPDQRRAARMTKAEARRQMADSAFAPLEREP